MRYQTIEFDNIDIHLCTLRDKQEFHDPDGVSARLGISSAQWSLFGVVWPSGVVLAKHLLNYQTNNKRILEIGCGMALSSLLLNKQNADITATDYHPDVGTFLQRNTELNDDADINFEQVNWSDKSDNLGLFDLIIGSDLLYEDEHTALIANFINSHAHPNCEIILVDPGRGRKNKLNGLMEKLGYQHSHIKPAVTDYLDKPFKGHILKFWRHN